MNADQAEGALLLSLYARELADGFTLLGHGVAPWERSARLSLED
jgi:hypothetical protein